MTELYARGRRPIDARYLEVILSGVEQAGLDVPRLLKRAHLEPEVIAGNAKAISQEGFARLISTLTRVTRDEFWLLGDRPIRLGTFNTMCRLIVQSSNLGSSLRTGFSFYHKTVSDFTMRMGSDGSEMRIWVTTSVQDPTRRRAICGAALFFVYGMMCWLVGKRLPLNSVRYAFGEHAFSSELAPFYDAPILFNQKSHELRFQKEILDLPIMPDEVRLQRFIKSMPSAMLVRYRDESSFSERVRAILRRNLAKHVSLEEVAARLNVSPQTLRRRLADGGDQGFQELKDQVRRDAAVRLLRTTSVPLEQIALQLGFSELSTFHRAFRRWTGLTPGSYRHTDPSATAAPSTVE
ncbi:AraC family transcriptional regulator [Tardiphaga alba]|uniref:AraC family transcriptional regulator n=1 Tax=Tardiphaga alba TaxID=340268 RepID=A0ABX8AHS3_9BRAD|nr:AraC family transcriptional regulator [Tardiphaga alba]QUS41943.1 AraC family transcriptional regulator [Tardiphaga alba]